MVLPYLNLLYLQSVTLIIVQLHARNQKKILNRLEGIEKVHFLRILTKTNPACSAKSISSLVHKLLFNVMKDVNYLGYMIVNTDIDDTTLISVSQATCRLIMETSKLSNIQR